MDRIVFVLSIVVLFSCKSNSVAQEKEASQEAKAKANVEKPLFVDHQNNISPGAVHLEATVIKIYKNDNVCGKSFKATISVKIDHVKGSGSGIVNMIATGQEITLGFRNAMVKDFDVLQEKLVVGQRFFFVLEEKLCRSGNDTVYMISRFEEVK